MNRLETISQHLDRMLGFFGRLESKASVIFAANIGIMAVMLHNFDYRDLPTWYVSLPLTLTVGLISISVWFLFLTSYPSLKGGDGSMFYFRSISSKTERVYISEFLSLSENSIAEDLLGQAWRNAQILSEKFSQIEKAFRFSLMSVAPWVWFLVASSIIHTRAIQTG